MNRVMKGVHIGSLTPLRNSRVFITAHTNHDRSYPAQIKLVASRNVDAQKRLCSARIIDNYTP